MNAPAEEISDDALLVLYANGDRRAAADLTARLGPRVFGVAMRVMENRAEAEDVTQEAMLRLWRTAPDWRPGEAKASTWLHRVAANLCIDNREEYAVGQEVNANHLRGVRSGVLTGIATIVHKGRTSQVWEIRIYNDEEKLSCISRLTMAIIPA